MISFDGFLSYNIWDHSPTVTDLYTRRILQDVEEMTCAAQAAELVKNLIIPKDTLLDVGCATGYFFQSLAQRNIPVEYYGIDATARFIDIGRSLLPSFGLPSERLCVGRIEDMNGQFDHIVCMNVLSNLDNYHRPLERMLNMARKSVILRESIKDGSEYRYVVDKYLDTSRPLRVYVNAYDRNEVCSFARELGFATKETIDQRTGGRAELVIDYPHYWTFLIMQRL